MTNPRLIKSYREAIAPAMVKEFTYKNPMQVPRITKVVINMGVGEALVDIKILEKAAADLAAITGQKPVICRAKKAISNFKVKQGNPIGCKVTLRGKMMFEFLDRLINVAMPRIRDFRGLKVSSFDGFGNYNFGVAEQGIFPEIEHDKITHTQGFDITIATTARNNKEALSLLKKFGIPFREDKDK